MVDMKNILYLFLALCSFSGTVYSDLTWTTPVAISTALTNASDPHTVIDASGNATAVWVESNVIKASYFPAGGSWGAPVSLSNVSNTSSSPKLAIDSSGNVTALWLENTLIESATLSGGVWSAETAPISSSGASSPAIAVDASGNAVAVWVRSAFIESSTRKSGIWSSVAVLSATNSSSPSVAISSFGTAIAGWHTLVSGSDSIVTDTLTVSTNTWAASKNVFVVAPAFNHNFPKVAMDPFGTAYVAWFRYNLVDSDAFENVQLLASVLNQTATTWSLAQIVDTGPGIRNPADLTIKLKVDGSGDVVLAWNNSLDGDNFQIGVAQKTFGSTAFQSPGLLNISTYCLALDVFIAAETALLTYMVWDGVSTLSIVSQESDINNPINQSWTFTNTVSTGSDNGFPSCSMSTTGSTFNSAAVWLNFNGTNTVINASTGTEAVTAPPTSVSATQSSTNFGVYTDFFNTITWSASSAPNVVMYNLFRNGVYFASTADASTFSFIDHNQINGGAVTYGVAAFTNDNRQSDIITFTLF
jgi:hypothetical protein